MTDNTVYAIRDGRCTSCGLAVSMEHGQKDCVAALKMLLRGMNEHGLPPEWELARNYVDDLMIERKALREQLDTHHLKPLANANRLLCAERDALREQNRWLRMKLEAVLAVSPTASDDVGWRCTFCSWESDDFLATPVHDEDCAWATAIRELRER